MTSLPPDYDRGAPSAILALFGAYLLMMLVGFSILRSPLAAPRGAEITLDRAIFTVINASTLTGFQLSVTPQQYKLGGQIAILVMTIGASLFTMIVGSAAVARIVRLPFTFRQIVIAAVVAEVLAIAIGTMLLMRPGVRMLTAAMLAAGAFGNSGVHIGGVPGLLDWRTHALLLPLALIGGLGLAVKMDLVRSVRHGQPLSKHSRVVLAMTAGLYLLGMLSIFAIEWRTGAAPSQLASTAAASSAAAMNARTYGSPLEWLATVPRAAQWIIMLLMAIGANPGGTGGGIKTATIAVLFIGARAALAGRVPGRAFGIACTWLAVYGGLVAAAMLVLLPSQPDIDADRLLMLCISAASNVGLSHDTVTIVGPGLYTLAFTMLAGRLVPLLILWWMATTTEDADIAVG